MDQVVRVKIILKPYRWKDFRHDVAFIFYVIIILTNAMTKKYFKRSLLQVVLATPKFLKKLYWTVVAGVFIGVFIYTLFVAPFSR